jgi:hypothetical protein
MSSIIGFMDAVDLIRRGVEDSFLPTVIPADVSQKQRESAPGPGTGPGAGSRTAGLKADPFLLPPALVTCCSELSDRNDLYRGFSSCLQ